VKDATSKGSVILGSLETYLVLSGIPASQTCYRQWPLSWVGLRIRPQGFRHASGKDETLVYKLILDGLVVRLSSSVLLKNLSLQKASIG